MALAIAGRVGAGTVRHDYWLDSIRYWGNRGHPHVFDYTQVARQQGPTGAPTPRQASGSPATLYFGKPVQEVTYSPGLEGLPFPTPQIEQAVCRRDNMKI